MVSPVCEAVHPNPLPAVEDGAVAVTLVELASVSPTGQPLTVRAPSHTSEAVLVAMAHLLLVSKTHNALSLAGNHLGLQPA